MDRVRLISTKLAKVVDRAVEANNSGVGCLETRVMVNADKFSELKTAHLGVEIAQVGLIDKSVRQVQSEYGSLQ